MTSFGMTSFVNAKIFGRKIFREISRLLLAKRPQLKSILPLAEFGIRLTERKANRPTSA